jgi:hypothetical protein
MKKQKILYVITTEDVINTSNQENIPFTENDLPLIEESIGNYFGDKWQDAIKYALVGIKEQKIGEKNGII